MGRVLKIRFERIRLQLNDCVKMILRKIEYLSGNYDVKIDDEDA